MFHIENSIVIILSRHRAFNRMINKFDACTSIFSTYDEGREDVTECPSGDNHRQHVVEPLQGLVVLDTLLVNIDEVRTELSAHFYL